MKTRSARLALAPVMYRRARRQAARQVDGESCRYYDGLADAFLWLAFGIETDDIAALLAPPQAGEVS